MLQNGALDKPECQPGFIRMRLMELTPSDRYKLFLRFDDGTCGALDFRPFTPSMGLGSPRHPENRRYCG